MTQPLDLVVVGGGIHGAGVAQAAAAAGYSVRVLEQYPALAQATSSRSSKLVHGGLRYLETAQLGLVSECLRERALLLRNAPALVSLKPFYIPVYESTRRRPWQLRAGLSLYALLGGLKRQARFRRLPPGEGRRLDGLRQPGLKAIFRYHDAQTDDLALTRAVMASAVDLGAELSLATKLERVGLSADGCTVRYRRDGGSDSCSARVVVNAAGPWANRVLACVEPAQTGLAVELVQGAHIVVPGKLEQGIYYVEAPADRRAVFVMPWHGNCLVGTTESAYTGDPDRVEPLAEEIDYLLETLAWYFPDRATGRDDILECYAGVRVLPLDKKNASKRSRETVLRTDRAHRPRLLSIYGGKLTAYRATADKVLARLRESLPERHAIADTRTLTLRPSACGSET